MRNVSIFFAFIAALTLSGCNENVDDHGRVPAPPQPTCIVVHASGSTVYGQKAYCPPKR